MLRVAVAARCLAQLTEREDLAGADVEVQQLVPDRGPVAAKAREVDDVTRRPRAFGDPLCQPRVQVAQAVPVAIGSSDRR